MYWQKYKEIRKTQGSGLKEEVGARVAHGSDEVKSNISEVRNQEKWSFWTHVKCLWESSGFWTYV